jgi:exopolyphosphatase/guanosine-5'-triphosphate,3'-diphosphate pyrophosphatase
LAGLLRLADGLDRRRTQAVKGLAGELTRSAFTLTLQGKGDLSVELHWGEEKGDLFTEAFRRRLVLKAGS